jgi:uncharacterized membrane protein
MIVRWESAVRAIGGVTDRLGGPDANLMLALLVLFLGWVIVSESRTRHLAKLIWAVRGLPGSQDEEK